MTAYLKQHCSAKPKGSESKQILPFGFAQHLHLIDECQARQYSISRYIVTLVLKGHICHFQW